MLLASFCRDFGAWATHSYRILRPKALDARWFVPNVYHCDQTAVCYLFGDLGSHARRLFVAGWSRPGSSRRVSSLLVGVVCVFHGELLPCRSACLKRCPLLHGESRLRCSIHLQHKSGPYISRFARLDGSIFLIGSTSVTLDFFLMLSRVSETGIDTNAAVTCCMEVCFHDALAVCSSSGRQRL